VIAQDIFKDITRENKTFEKVVDQQFCGKCERFLADRFVRGTCPMCGYHDAKGDQCDGCGNLINATELINPQCTSCSTTPEVRQSKHIFIDLPKI
jgi:methionyl-tRNA synthetase